MTPEARFDSAMDTPRTRPARRRWPLLVGALVIGSAIVAIWLNSSSPAAPTIARSTVVIDSVIRGDLVSEVRAPGTLVPEHVRYLTAQTSARVERLLAEPGARVRAGEILLVLSNPDVLTQMLEAEQRVQQARIDLVNLRSTLRLEALSQEGVVASMATQEATATQGQRVADSLYKSQYISRVESANAAALASEMSSRLRVERERLDLMRAAVSEQEDAMRGQVAQLEAIATNQRARLQSLEVRAPTSGVLQELDLQLGQWVSEGAFLARIIQPEQLKAVLRIAESDAAEIAPGQTVSVDIRSSVIAGRVARKATGAVDGIIPVDVTLQTQLPTGAVPDLNVDAIVQLNVVPQVLSLGRPSQSTRRTNINLFKVMPDGNAAVRVRVQLGAVTATRAEVLSGLGPGDRVIVSDMNAYATYDRVRLK
jgi:HlyD family secretion protein